MDLWGYPLQGVYKFKTVFTVILTCCLLFSLLTFALSLVKLLVPYHESRQFGLAGRKHATVTSKCLCWGRKLLVLFNLSPWVFILLIICEMMWEVLRAHFSCIWRCDGFLQRKACVVFMSWTGWLVGWGFLMEHHFPFQKKKKTDRLWLLRLGYLSDF